jgi:hypothetical protein
MTPNSVIAALRVSVSGDSVCGGCLVNVQLSGQCHAQECANQTQIELVRASILDCIRTFVSFLSCE